VKIGRDSSSTEREMVDGEAENMELMRVWLSNYLTWSSCIDGLVEGLKG
jgi:hypothetical protein